MGLKKFGVLLCIVFMNFVIAVGSANADWTRGAIDNTTPAYTGHDWGVGEYTEPVFTINGHAVHTASQHESRQGGMDKSCLSVPVTQQQDVLAPENSGGSSASGSAHGSVQASYGKLPLYFIKNDGQVDDRVKYYEKGSGHAMYFTEEGVYVLLEKRQEARSDEWRVAGDGTRVAGGKKQEAGMRDEEGEKGRSGESENKVGWASPTITTGSEPLSLLNPDVCAADKKSPLGLSPNVVVGEKGDNGGCENQQPLIVKLVPLGANKHPEIVAEGLQQGKVNYFIGNNPEEWRTNIPTYGAVVYKEIYKGIDIKFYGNNRQLEYDIIVKPGADPSQVRFAYEGVEDLRINEDGDLEIILSKSKSVTTDFTDSTDLSSAQTGDKKNPESKVVNSVLRNPHSAIEVNPNSEISEAGCALPTIQLVAENPKLIQRRPYVYQEIGGKRVEIKGEFRVLSAGSGECRLGEACPEPVERSSIRSAQDKFNPSLYTKHEVRDTKSENSSPVTRHPPLIYGFTIAPYDTAHALIIDPVLTYSTYIGGSSADYGYGIAVDGAGFAYITGNAASSNFPVVGTTTANAGANDAFVTKLGTSGASIEYSTYIGGSGNDYSYGIAVDGTGSAYITGDTQSNNFPVMGTTTALHGSRDAFVTKLGTSGASIEYSTYIGGDNLDYGRGIAVDGAGSAYITGNAQSSNFPVVGTTTAHAGGTDDAFVTKLGTGTPNLQIVYSTYIGGSNGDVGRGIAVDGTGSAYITGDTQSNNFPVVGTTTALHGSRDAFVTRLGTSGASIEYSTYIGGSSNDYGFGIAVDGTGSAYITGNTASSDFPVVGTTTAYATNTDAFVTRLGTSGASIEYSTYIGGSSVEEGYGIAVDDTGSAYITGNTNSSNFPVVGTTTAHAGGTYDAFVTRLGTSGASIEYSTYIGGSGNDYGFGIAVDGTGSAYITGNTTSSNFPRVGTTTANAGANDAFVTRLAFTPGVTTGSSSGVTTSGATLSGTFNGYGRTTTTLFQYGVTSGAYTGTSSTSSLTGSEGNTTVEIALSGLSAGTTYYYRAAASNSAGTSTGEEASFTTSSSSGGGGGGGWEPPAVTLSISSTSPSSGATDVSVTEPVSATFNIYVNGLTVTTETFKLGSENGDVEGSVVTNGATITFTPSLSLLYGTKYTGTVTTKIAAANFAGTTMESAYSWSFTTENATAVTPTPAASPSPTPAATVTPAATPKATVTPTPAVSPSPTATATSTPVPTPPLPTPTITAAPTLPPPPPTQPPVPTPTVSIAPTPKASPTPAACTAESMAMSSYRLRLKWKKSKEVIATVTGSDGCLVEGDEVVVKIDKNSKKYISVLPKKAATDANGQARFRIKAGKKKGNGSVAFICEEMKETVTVNVIK